MPLESDFESNSSVENPISREIRKICTEDLESPIQERLLGTPQFRSTPIPSPSPGIRRKKNPFNGGTTCNPLRMIVSPSYSYKLCRAPSDPGEILRLLRNLKVPQFSELGGSAGPSDDCRRSRYEEEQLKHEYEQDTDEDSISRLLLDVMRFNHQLDLYEFRKTILVDKLEALILESSQTIPPSDGIDYQDRGYISREQTGSYDSDQENNPLKWRTNHKENNLAKESLGLTPIIPPLKGILRVPK
ncbi:uncharacterized protein KQ657_003385 [Scheffersomyces spartinae]|uniref:Uncharacterized protein n=1 Tax=Scheffersomyces spartinae TaxID=45513 RepID=A0A9P8AK98_9ASCO|nr:uncharacterized protein KQ657_003385 [Scheffersomyces spartinae]KAG7195618.1 hypothetical protein KQ657_003385 [Scheffersomyces spartinae]